jgi:hypothetical protein
MAYDPDPVEFIGSDHKVRAVPKNPNLVAEMPPPTPAKSGTTGHAKHAVKAPRLAYEAAVLETQAARIELEQVTAAFRKAEHDEGARLVEWGSLNRRSPDAVIREYLRREGEMRAANVAAGRPANQRGPAVVSADQSPITLAALNRGRHAGGNRLQAGTPLRSNIARRHV